MNLTKDTMREFMLPCFLGLLVLSTGTARAEIKEQIVAVVNDEVITYSELDKILSPIFERYEQIYSGAELFSMLQKARRDVLNHLIERALILQEAKRENVRERMGDEIQKQVAQEISKVKSKFPSEEVFLEQLEHQGMTSDEFRTQMEEGALIQAMIGREVSSRCAVSPGEVREYYENNKKEFTEEEKYHVFQIWIREDPEKPGGAEKQAKELIKKLEKGEPFDKLARKYSSGPYAKAGGDWGYISRGHWNCELENAAFCLEPGTHSGIVKTDLGYHIVKLGEKKSPSLIPLDKIYKDIENRLFQEKVDTKRKEWIERLKRHAYICVVK
jgi:peptidyl-prolyl cis-trans isomerase SurA